MEEIYSFLRRINIKNKSIVVAVSGGPDSMFLLEYLKRNRENFNINIICAHINHNIRIESNYEEDCINKYCRDNNIIFEAMKIEKYTNNKFTEVEARNIRYKFFFQLMEKYSSDILFTAHHGDDLIETILMRITRGSNLKGYSGIQRISNHKGKLIARPLLLLTKDYILNYLDNNNIWYAVDNSNFTDEHTRNRYRNNILPLLKKENRNINLKFSKFSNLLLEANEYIYSKAYQVYEEMKIHKNKINAEKLKEHEKIIRKYILQIFLDKIYGDDIFLISDIHVDKVLELIDNSNNFTFNLPKSYKVILEYGVLSIEKNKKIEKYNYIFDKEVILPNGRSIKIDNETKLENNHVIHLNSKEIKFPLYIRTREKKDTIKVKNMSSYKKVSEIFTNEKIPKLEREYYPIVVDNEGEIIWIPGVKKSHFDRKKEGKYDIILKYD